MTHEEILFRPVLSKKILCEHGKPVRFDNATLRCLACVCCMSTDRLIVTDLDEGEVFCLDCAPKEVP